MKCSFLPICVYETYGEKHTQHEISISATFPRNIFRPINGVKRENKCNFSYCNVYSCFYAMTARMGEYSKPVSGQRLGKHVPAATDTHATEETVCFCVVRAEML
jgi:hypothetical protein